MLAARKPLVLLGVALAASLAASAGWARSASRTGSADLVSIRLAQRAFASVRVPLDIALDFRQSGPRLPELVDLRPTRSDIRPSLEVVVYRSTAQASADAKRLNFPHPKGAPHTVIEQARNVLALIDSRTTAKLKIQVGNAMKLLRE